MKKTLDVHISVKADQAIDGLQIDEELVKLILPDRNPKQVVSAIVEFVEGRIREATVIPVGGSKIQEVMDAHVRRAT